MPADDDGGWGEKRARTSAGSAGWGSSSSSSQPYTAKRQPINAAARAGGGWGNHGAATQLEGPAVGTAAPGSGWGQAPVAPEPMLRGGGWGAAADPPTQTWRYRDDNGVVQGPFSKEQIENWISQGRISAHLMVKCGKCGKYKQAGNHPELRGAFWRLGRRRQGAARSSATSTSIGF